MAIEGKKLYRQPEKAMIAGVAAGLAEYFELDVTLMRLVFVAIGIMTSGMAVAGYIVLAIVMPTPDTENKKSKTVGENIKHNADNLVAEMNASGRTDNLRNVFGLGLVLFGAWLLLQQFVPWLEFRWDFFWPAVLILIGVVILSKSKE